MKSDLHICMLAAENDVIPGAKVGGIGDVIRDIPVALAEAGASLTVVIPSYGLFHTTTGANYLTSVQVPFRKSTETVTVFEVCPQHSAGVRYYVLHHALFASGGNGQVYANDGNEQPFATDASKFALFSMASAVALRDKVWGAVDVLHLHDWHTGLVALLRAYDNSVAALKDIPCVFSIHNLALQGIRPLAGHESSLQSWFPHLHYDPAGVTDPRWPNCVNPMIAGIRLADKVHTVSPTYASEIILANDPARGFHGGEGLEADLQRATDEGRLLGIINGINYAPTIDVKEQWPGFIQTLAVGVLAWTGSDSQIRAVDYVAHQRCLQWQSKDRPLHVLTSVGRLTDQKLALLLSEQDNGTTTLENLLISLQDRGVLIVLGTGEAKLESLCQQIAARHHNFLFLNRYAQHLADTLFANGDLFLMPSSFEPCGISQMLAMRQAQPCLAHAVGGLCDTIQDGIDGFHFNGNSLAHQSSALLQRLNTVLSMRETHNENYQEISKAASSQRFEWAASAHRYLTDLYP